MSSYLDIEAPRLRARKSKRPRTGDRSRHKRTHRRAGKLAAATREFVGPVEYETYIWNVGDPQIFGLEHIECVRATHYELEEDLGREGSFSDSVFCKDLDYIYANYHCGEGARIDQAWRSEWAAPYARGCYMYPRGNLSWRRMKTSYIPPCEPHKSM